MATKVQDEIIAVTDVSVAPRGRKKVLDTALVALFASLTEGQAVRLRARFGEVDKAQRASVSATIRKNWSEAQPSHKCKVDFGADGIPQVRFGKLIEADA